MVKAIRPDDQSKQVIEELRQQLAVTETLLLKVLQKTGDVTITAEELAQPVEDNLVIDMDLDEQSQVWTFTLKDDEDD